MRAKGGGVHVGEVIDRVAADLRAAGIGDAGREALVLWASAAGISPAQAWLDRNAGAASDTAARCEVAARQRARGVPMAYAAGSAAFRTLDLLVDHRALIPRPETEGLVEHVLAYFRARSPTASVSQRRSAPPGALQRPPAPTTADGMSSWGTAADIGTGTGCIALSLAAEGRFAHVIATDIDEGALALARENGAMQRDGGAEGRGGFREQRSLPRHPAPALIDFRLGGMLAPLRGSAVDAIVSNPPYVSQREWDALDPGVRDHEPRIALVSPDGGLSHTRALLGDARELLNEGGLLAIEVDSARADAVLTIARGAGWANARLERDLFGRFRYLLATKGSP